jgi:hypothetical protein
MCAMALITFDALFSVPSHFWPLPCSVFVGLRVIGSPRHERAAMEGAEAAKRRQEQLEKEVREYHERDGRQMGSGGKQPLDQLLASGAAHQRCSVRRRKRVWRMIAPRLLRRKRG